jgi:hypothetical protein
MHITSTSRLVLTGCAVAPLVTTALLAAAGSANAQVPDAAKAASVTAKAGPTRIPISASVSGAVNVDPTGKLWPFTADGAGTMRGYGKVHFHVSGKLNVNRACPSFTGTETVRVLRSGNRLIGQVTGDGCPQRQHAAVLDVRAFTGVTSGTGRFAGADGGWLVTGTLDTAHQTFTHQLTGLVIVPAT